MKTSVICLLVIISQLGCKTSKKEVIENNSEVYYWNFRDYKQITYNYEQKSSTSFAFTEDPVEQDIEAQGHLVVRIQDSSMAEVGLSEIEAKIFQGDKNAGSSTQTIPYGIIEYINPDGSGGAKGEKTNSGIVSFLLPDKQLKKGEKSKREIRMPYNINGSQIYFKGEAEFELVEFKTIQGDECVVFKFNYKISEPDTPTKLEGTEFLMTGSGTSVFNLDKGYLLEAHDKNYMNASSEQRSQVDIPGEETEIQSTTIAMKMDNEVILKFKEAE